MHLRSNIIILVLFMYLPGAWAQDAGDIPDEFSDAAEVTQPADAITNEPVKTAPLPAPVSNRVTDLMLSFPVEVQELRDPFAIPTTDKPVAPGSIHGPIQPLQKFALSDLKVTGIIWDVSRPKAMVLAPGGATHIVGLNAKIGNNNGYVAVIREGEIVVVETTEDQGRLISSATTVKMAAIGQQQQVQPGRQ